MILNQLTLTNFGIYKGEHTVPLTPSAKKPIILFGAYNGSGKTTFLDALQLVLYGKTARTSGRAKMPYDDYLRLLINRDISPKIGAGISLTFTTLQNGKKEKIEVTRSWAEAGNTIKEHCSVKRNDLHDETTSDRWNEFVEEFMPSEISELFFFDGEKIEGLADPVRSASFIRSGIYSLLGINSIESLLKSLTQIEKKKASEIANSKGDISLEVEEKEAGELSKKKERLAQEIAGLLNELDKVSLDISKAEEEMKSSGANLFANRHKLQEQASVLKEQQKRVNAELHELSSSKAPLLLLGELLADLKNTMNAGSGHNFKSLELLKSEVSLIKKTFKGADQLKVVDALDKRIDVLTNEVSNTSLDLEKSEIPTTEELSTLKALVHQTIKSSEHIADEIDRINKNLLAVPAEDKVQAIVELLNKKQSEKIKLETKHEMLLSNLSEVSLQQDKVSREISNKLSVIASQQTGLIVSQRVLLHAQKAKETLSKFKTELINKHLSSLGIEITNCFKTLQRKTNFNLIFEINAKTFTLEINKLSVEHVSAKTLSAGERQLLAVAILWALAKSSGKVLPTVIDTPLGRLDGPHREKLISNYFPKASSQVLIFSTDEEISKEHYIALKPYISREYSIDYDDTTESSQFNEDYFNYEVV